MISRMTAGPSFQKFWLRTVQLSIVAMATIRKNRIVDSALNAASNRLTDRGQSFRASIPSTAGRIVMKKTARESLVTLIDWACSGVK